MSHLLEDLAKSLLQQLPNEFKNFEQELHLKFREIIKTTFEKLDFVSREEFDVQVKVLAKTRQKLEALEQALNEFKSNTQP